MSAKDWLSRPAISGAVLIAGAMPAFAHHVMGGKLPATFAQGFLSGLGHPIIGVDHFVFVVGVGLLAGVMQRKLLLSGIFILCTLGGTWLHVSGLSVPFAELVIVLSVALLAAIMIADIRIPIAAAATSFGIAGLFHGYAYGESIFGAEPTPLFAYLGGFAVVQLAIALAAAWGVEQLGARGEALAQTSRRVIGGAMAGVALVAISNIAFGS
jgi:urease accessory protein